MQSNNIGITALYCRLSRDDGNKENESNSIENQKIMLSRYAQEKGFENTRFYVDDGFTGTNFNRPDFKRMMEDVEAGYISTIIVKDMSRFGRNYVEVGLYTESYFPENNIRFIAITDLVDSADGENEIIPFKNVMNEMYARDILRKVRCSYRILERQRYRQRRQKGTAQSVQMEKLNYRSNIVSSRILRRCYQFQNILKILQKQNKTLEHRRELEDFQRCSRADN